MNKENEKYDFKPLGEAIKAARKAKGISRNQLADKMNIVPRYIASIENSGQHPSFQIFYELVTLLDVSVEQFLFPDKDVGKNTQRRQLDAMLDSMNRPIFASVILMLERAEPSFLSCRRLWWPWWDLALPFCRAARNFFMAACSTWPVSFPVFTANAMVF